MTLPESQSFLKEFKRRLPERVAELSGAIQATENFSHWEPDLTPKSLVDVGKWLLEVVERRPLRADEPTFVGGIAGTPHGTFWNDFRARIQVFTDASWSPLVDASMYFCECVRMTSARWSWKRCWLKGASISNQPVLVLDRLAGTEIPPFEIGRNFTRNILEERLPADYWREMYDRRLEGEIELR